ncbi:accessory Sec system translocase SecA2, actinobacterial type [Gottschalkia purinilytica]|uniref:Protein translocase subunit SecA n=1 Tax=Gottschalkia purinilytica TaxID=1503 RepID=A0A0L0W7V0_GOTPU|nr:accessory Sec system translocase SecA2 [Gottschalkia purinilytica]KNF07619.1 accessory Sec system translocase SecA2, actinobacterial type [Gottschalkia purinilytica]
MSNKLSKLIDFIRNLQNPMEYDLEPYKKVLEEINNIKLRNLSDYQLKELSIRLKKQARDGISHEKLLTESFALVRETSRRVLGMCPFDTQIMAGIALHRDKIVEMKTGEGKTLAATMPAYLNALTGKGVHILTFNDYLAGRDAECMGHIYEFLGLTVGHIKEDMDIYKKQNAYWSDITYVTTKESGFDYLRDFLCMEKEKLVHRPLHYAIIDEADSILIDETRSPLVIAGKVEEDVENQIYLSDIVRNLKPNDDYETDKYKRDVYLTDKGLSKVEDILGCDNLYHSKNLELLTKINCALHAEVLLKKDRDYIIRNEKIEIIDEFTGRVADKRHWPHNIQVAVEAKEGIVSESNGIIMGSIALQHYLSLYPRISGMTGTANTAAEELIEFYNKDVVVIHTSKPCIRKDHPNMIFANKLAKQKAIVSKIKRVHKTGQPILIGTGSVEESELLAHNLREEGINCQVLNAKNDEMEAKIIARAGEIGAVTVSTNMAGRGIDIKLGGEKELDRDKVCTLGGLYVIGTSLHESRRIYDQLKGRAGRQGDPGESRFFISLDDELIQKYDVSKLISHNYSPKHDEVVEDPVIHQQLERGQRIIEGYNSDMRRQLWKYSFIIEQQRRIIHNKRQDILIDKVPLKILSIKAAERYDFFRSQVGEETLRKVEKQIILYCINKCWADYLDYISHIRETIHLVVIGGKNPLDEFRKIAIEAFDEMMNRIEHEIVNTFHDVEINEDGIKIDKARLKVPSSTWTYLIDDSPDQFSNLPLLVKTVTTTITGTLFSLQSIYKRIFKKKKISK